MLLPYVKSTIYHMADNNSNTSFDNSKAVKELSDFSILKLSNMEPSKKVSDIHCTVLPSTQGSFEQTEVWSLHLT